MCKFFIKASVQKLQRALLIQRKTKDNNNSPTCYQIFLQIRYLWKPSDRILWKRLLPLLSPRSTWVSLKFEEKIHSNSYLIYASRLILVMKDNLIYKISL